MKLLGERLLVEEGRPPFLNGGTSPESKIIIPELVPKPDTFWAHVKQVVGPKTSRHVAVGDWIFCSRMGGVETKEGRIISILDVLVKWEPELKSV